MCAEDLNRTIAELEAEEAAVDAELRRRKDVLDKSRKQYETLLDALGVTHEELQEFVRETEFPPEAVSMLRETLAESRRGDDDGGEVEDKAAGDAPKKKRKKRMIVKL